MTWDTWRTKHYYGYGVTCLYDMNLVKKYSLQSTDRWKAVAPLPSSWYPVQFPLLPLNIHLVIYKFSRSSDLFSFIWQTTLCCVGEISYSRRKRERLLRGNLCILMQPNSFFINLRPNAIRTMPTKTYISRLLASTHHARVTNCGITYHPIPPAAGGAG